jgi:hypothetical protein
MKVFRLGNGQYTAEIHAAPIHFRSGEGAWADVDRALKAASRADAIWTIRTASAEIRFDRPGSGALVSLETGRARVAYALADANPASVPVVAGTTVTYPEIRRSVDLVLDARQTGLKDVLVLRRRPESPVRFTFRLELVNAHVSPLPNGGIAINDRQGRPVFEIPPPTMSDSTLNGQRSLSADIRTTLTRRGRYVEVSLEPSLRWLTAAERVYPVMLDPSLNLVSTVDTYVDSRFPTVRRDTETTFQMVGPIFGTSVVKLPLLQFDLAALAGTSVLDADLFLFMTSGSCSQTRTMDVVRVTSAWAADVTWASQPSVDSSFPAATRTSCPSNAWVTFDVTTLAKYWMSGIWQNHGVQLRPPEADLSAWTNTFHSVENTNDPYLAVTYEAFAGAPTAL